MGNCEVLSSIKKLEKLIFRKIVKENGEVKPKNIPTPTQMEIIDYILDHLDEEVYQKDLENILGLRRATVSGVLMTMEKNHLVTRKTNPKDTRSKKVILNPKTKEIFSKNLEKMKKIENEILIGISTEELNTFLAVINKMENNIKK